MFRFGVENLRRLKKVESLDLKPITVLVGRNSAGKSTFLRSFALLRQSIVTRISSPILWYGDIVDFGSFKGSVYSNDTDLNITFSFGLDSIRPQMRPYVNHYGALYFAGSEGDELRDLDLKVSVSAYQETSRICSICLHVESTNVLYQLQVGKDGHVTKFDVDRQDALSYFKGSRMVISSGSLFPDVLFIPLDPSGDASPAQRIPGDFRHPIVLISGIITPFLDKRMRKEAIEDIAFELLSLKSFSKEAISNYANRTQVRSWQKVLFEIAGKDKNQLFPRLSHIFRATQFRSLIAEMSSRLKATLSQTLYIGPARARSERYYRYQDLSVSEIDPDGKNFPMFLNSLSKSQQTSLSDWVERLFNYRIVLEPSGGHISINLVEGDSTTNIVDTGYGVSQILPVLGQIWWSIHKDRGRQRGVRRSEVSMLSIEQPELHLHPAHQAMLADALLINHMPTSKGSAEQNRPHFLIETHSEAFVNRLGELIAAGHLKADNVQILVFSPDEEDERATKVMPVNFTENGNLLNWPYGFFLPAA